jgi:hypothetical protein
MWRIATSSFAALAYVSAGSDDAATLLQTGAAPQKKAACGTLKGTATCKERNDCLWHDGGCAAMEKDNTRCNDGGANSVPCLDLDKCAADIKGPTPTKRWAFVYTDTRDTISKIREDSLAPLREAAAKIGNTDIILMVPGKGAPLGSGSAVGAGLSNMSRKAIEAQGIKIEEVPWVLPPKMKFLKKGGGWCGPKDLMRLHILGMEHYDSVVYLDTDVQPTGNGDLSKLLKCAANGRFISASGPLSPFNLGMFALRPSKALLNASVHFAQIADYDDFTGWGDAGTAPHRGSFTGSECGQGFLHTLFYKTSSKKVKEAITQSKAKMPDAQQVDRCIWNYQKGWGCEKNLNCDSVVLIHKEGDCKKKVVQATNISQKV